MNFKPAEPNRNFIHREVSESGTVEIGVYPVMFGFRVRAGFINNDYVHIDWCCGNNQFVIERMYSVLKSIFSKREEDAYCFKGLLSHSEIKPFFKDEKFVMWISKHIPEDFKEESLPDLHALKAKYMEELFPEFVFPVK